MRRILIGLMTAALTIMALANIASACGPWAYQPEVPERFKG